MNYPVLEEPQDYFKGIGQGPLPTPTDILFFMRGSKKTLQQHALQNRSHHRFVLIFNLETPGHVHADNRVLPFAPGQALLILPYQFHHFSQLASAQLHWLFCTFEFKPETFLEPLRNRVLAPRESTLQTLDTLLEEWKSNEQPGALLQATLTRLLLMLKQENLAADATLPTESSEGLLCSINRLMSELRGSTVTIRILAAALNLSESRLRTRFKETAGIPLGRYIQNYRLNRAMALLRTTRLPIADLAEEAGFGSPQAFCRIFKEKSGQTPREYRQQI